MEVFVGLVVLVLAIALVGFLVYIITENVPMSPLFKQCIQVATVVVVVIVLLGILVGRIPLPTLPWGRS